VQSSLTVDVGTTGLGTSTWASMQQLKLDNGKFYATDGSSVTFSNGGIDATAGTPVKGDVYVKGGATVTFTQGFSLLNPTLTVGDAEPGGTAGTVVLTGLTQLITSSLGGNINVTSTGTFKMSQSTADSTSTRGMIQPGTTNLGTFTNAGTFIRDGGSADGTY